MSTLTVLTNTMSLFRSSLKIPASSFWRFPQRSSSNQPSDFELQFTTPKCVKVESFPLALYGGRHTVSMIPGIGVGPELCKYVEMIFKKIGAPVDFEVVHIDAEREDDEGLENALVSIKRNGIAIKGSIERKCQNPMLKARNVILRNELDLFVYVLWCKSYPKVPSKHKDVDIILIRQNTEGEYSMLEHSIGGNKVVESLKIVRRDSSIRLAQYAFEYAKKYCRKKVTTIHKANIMKYSDGLFLDMSRQVAKNYPNIKHDHMIVDNCCMQIVAKPHQFDVILTTNLYGSILANIMCGLTGGPGLMSGKNYGNHYAIFEPGTRNEGTTIAGKNVANPVAMLNASVNMLLHLGHDHHACQLEKAICKTICDDNVRTPDLGGSCSTSQVIEKIVENL